MAIYVLLLSSNRHHINSITLELSFVSNSDLLETQTWILSLFLDAH